MQKRFKCSVLWQIPASLMKRKSFLSHSLVRSLCLKWLSSPWSFQNARAGMAMDAHKVYQQMIASGVTPTAYIYTALISGFAKDLSILDSVGYAKKYFLEMLDRGMKPHYKPYMDLINAIACEEPEEEVNKFLEQIKAKGLSLDNYSFPYKEGHLTKQMEAICMSTDLVDNNTVVKKYLEKLLASPWEIIELSLSMHCALLEDGNVNEATKVCNSIQHTVTEPSVILHTLVIESYLKFGKVKGALKAYRGMLAAGVAPNSYTYTVLIKGLTADPLFSGDAKKCLLEMMEKGDEAQCCYLHCCDRELCKAG
ncbi:PREDICTED: pentatricopeptide repeat-containing protein At5g41170, mitochondrial-like [Fragaria vesca subsp. vesca]|uniref:pentatricopeptide repeat-containing protein At5g41170, mitochondrial-like n=1 Tax=Fragaria vesca subsp. vesca TaxID=101020 RepID=UPI0002C35D9A|nr:PREDICTED: pentatricopeptide repeat-containing protein At5g41170, mitochondrial-like [Fragaria vesca subsp. vesca]